MLQWRPPPDGGIPCIGPSSSSRWLPLRRARSRRSAGDCRTLWREGDLHPRLGPCELPLGKELAAWHSRIERDWHAIHFGQLQVVAADEHLEVTVPVYLGALDRGHVIVEAYADAVGGRPSECLTMKRVDDIAGALNGGLYRAEIRTTRPASDYTPRVVAHHSSARVPIEAWPIAWYR